MLLEGPIVQLSPSGKNQKINLLPATSRTLPATSRTILREACGKMSMNVLQRRHIVAVKELRTPISIAMRARHHSWPAEKTSFLRDVLWCVPVAHHTAT